MPFGTPKHGTYKNNCGGSFNLSLRFFKINFNFVIIKVINLMWHLN